MSTMGALPQFIQPLIDRVAAGTGWLTDRASGHQLAPPSTAWRLLNRTWIASVVMATGAEGGAPASLVMAVENLVVHWLCPFAVTHIRSPDRKTTSVFPPPPEPGRSVLIKMIPPRTETAALDV